MSRRPRNPSGGVVTELTMKQFRRVMRLALKGVTLAEAAHRADCSENTICRIIRGENVSVRTAARICESLGYRLSIGLTIQEDEKPQDIALPNQ